MGGIQELGEGRTEYPRFVRIIRRSHLMSALEHLDRHYSRRNYPTMEHMLAKTVQHAGTRARHRDAFRIIQALPSAEALRHFPIKAKLLQTGPQRHDIEIRPVLESVA